MTNDLTHLKFARLSNKIYNYLIQQMTKLVNEKRKIPFLVCDACDICLLCLFLTITCGDIGHLRDKKGTGSGDSYRGLLVDDVCLSEKFSNLFA